MMRYTLQVVIAAVGILTGALLSVGDTYAASTTVKKVGATVVDATGKVVGQVVGINLNPGSYDPVVALNISTPSIILQVTSNDFHGNFPLFFSGANCTGQVYFSGDQFFPNHLLPIVGVFNNVLYGPQANANQGLFSVQSSYDFLNRVCQSYVTTIPLIIANPIIDLSTQFTPPYSFVP